MQAEIQLLYRGMMHIKPTLDCFPLIPLQKLVLSYPSSPPPALSPPPSGKLAGRIIVTVNEAYYESNICTCVQDPCWFHLIKYAVENGAYRGCPLPAVLKPLNQHRLPAVPLPRST